MGITQLKEFRQLMPEDCITAEMQQGVLVRLDVKELNQALAFPLSLWSFKSKNPTPVRQALIKHICEVMNELVGKYQQV